MKNGIHFHLERAGRFLAKSWRRNHILISVLPHQQRWTTSVVQELGLKSFSWHSLRFWVNSRENAYFVMDRAPLFFHHFLELLVIRITTHPSIKGIPVGAIESDIMSSAEE